MGTMQPGLVVEPRACGGEAPIGDGGGCGVGPAAGGGGGFAAAAFLASYE